MLRARADTRGWKGDREAALQLADLLAEHGRVDEALAIVRARAAIEDSSPARRLADLLAEQGRVDEPGAGSGVGLRGRLQTDLIFGGGRAQSASAVDACPL
jgi:hypothetical protein